MLGWRTPSGLWRSLVSALDWGSRGREFESPQPDNQAPSSLRRELREELGLEDFAVGPLLWRRQHTYSWDGRRLCQRERYYLVEAPRFEPHMSDPVEARIVERMRWWTQGELAAAKERLTPLSLAQIVAGYLRAGAPPEPLDLEVLVD